MKIRTFEDLPVWEESVSLARRIHTLTSTGTFKHDFPLRDQLRKSIISVSSNIAEGFERNNNREFIRFLTYAKASAAEARNQIHLAIVFGHITKPEGLAIVTALINICASLNGFIQYLKHHLAAETRLSPPKNK